MITIDSEATTIVPHPAAPSTLDAAGVNIDLVTQLTLKTLHFIGEATGLELGRRLCVPYSVLEPGIEMLKAQRHVEIAGGSMVGAPSYRYRITDAGRARAGLFLEQNLYVGAVPVPLSQYCEYMTAFAAAVPTTVSRDKVKQALSHLVVSQRVIDQLGPAINAQHSMFVYGPPGNGKTVISQAIKNLLTGDIAVPRALEIEGSIIRFFDPVNHEELPLDQDPEVLHAPVPYDHRWVRCRRPLVMVGGELTLDNLDLKYNPTSGFYQVPVQATANGGVLVIDDFGRQACSPRDLLNRWIVPLESRVDFLTLQSGQKFPLPFSAMVVFATNIKPAQLVDEAFLRRIQYKIFAESPTVEEFIVIFANCCREKGIPYEAAIVEHLLINYLRPRKIALRGCQPRDLINQALSLAKYLGEPPRLTPDLLDAACASYFVDDQETPVVYA